MESSRPVPGALYRNYLDPRANLPYYIYRLSGVELVHQWREVVTVTSGSLTNYQGILQGFFAGEGNVKFGACSSRVLRIAQGVRFDLLEKILKHFHVTFRYEQRERSYIISGRDNLEKLWELDIAKLHFKKRANLANMMSTYKQLHYRRLSFSPKVSGMLSSPATTHEIATRVSRSESRVCHTLTQLRRDGQVEMFKVRSSYYWIRTDQDRVVISTEKFRLLNMLTRPQRVSELARIVQRTHKAVARRLTEMSRLGLVEERNNNWCRIEGKKRVIVK